MERITDGNGNDVSSNPNHLANLNPLRYRSYYYDTETGLYYLNSRYYDPQTGRFINADDIQYLDPESLGGLSLYAYCLNNPVNIADENGNWSVWATLGVVVGAVVGAVAGAKAGAGSWYNSMAQEFTNAGSNEVVLGRSGTYEAVAESRGSTYFHTTDARWTEVHDMFGVGDKGM